MDRRFSVEIEPKAEGIGYRIAPVEEQGRPVRPHIILLRERRRFGAGHCDKSPNRRVLFSITQGETAKEKD